MRHLVTILALAMASTAFGQTLYPGTITASLNGDCEIVVATTSLPDHTGSLLECRYELFYYQFGCGYQTKLLGYAPYDADTLYFDMPDLPSYVTSVRVLKRMSWQTTSYGEVWRRSNYAYILAHCTALPPLPPPPPTPWQDANTVTPMGGSAQVSAADAGIWLIHDAMGYPLGNGTIGIGENWIDIPPTNNQIVHLTCYFFHQGEVQVITLSFL